MEDLWIALVEVVPMEGHELYGTIAGAYCNFLAKAETKQHFIQYAHIYCLEQLLEIVQVEDVELFGERQSRLYLSDELRSLAEEAATMGGGRIDKLYTFVYDYAE